MYSILIVDDEQIIREGLRTIVDWNSLGFDIAGTAENGRQAIEFIHGTPVDVILADIKMPRMSGLELSSIIEKEYPFTRVIILSGYDNFDYAQKAIRNRVFSYLLKPCREEEIEDVFSRLFGLMEKERSRDRLADTAEKNRLRDELYSAITGSGDEDSMLRNWFALKENSVYYVSFVRIFDCNLSKSRFNIFMESVEAALPGQTRAICTLPEENAAAVLLQISTNYEQESALFNKIIYDLSAKTFSGRVTAGVSSGFHSISALHSKYTEAYNAEDFSIFNNPGEFSEQATEIVKRRELSSAIASIFSPELIFDSLSGTDETTLSGSIDSFFNRISAGRPVGRSGLTKYLLGIFNRTEALLSNNGYPPGSILENPDEFENSLKSCALIDDFRDCLKSRALKWMAGIIKHKNDLKSPIIRKSIVTLNKRYGDDISLENIADSLQVTPNYFSRLFKKETGINYKDYLLRIRIEQAKKLLKSSQDKIYEIADRVGYSDHRYFSEVFKKETGMSPKEYRSSSVRVNEIF